jgi:microcystin-dependent protein
MPRVSGIYTLPVGNPVTTGTTITSNWANTTLTDIGTTLTNSIATDGQTSMVANLPMGNNKITGLANGTASTDAVAFGQLAVLLPTGIITMWSGSIASIPAGWFLCNGSNGTPDLRDRFIVGAGTSYAVSATGGTNDVTLNDTQMPSHGHGFSATTSAVSNNHTHSFDVFSGAMSANNTHSHTISDPGHNHPLIVSGGGSGAGVVLGGGGTISFDPYVQNANTGITGTSSVDINHVHQVSGATGGQSAGHTHTLSGTTTLTGGTLAHENRPPYYALAYIMKA